VNEMAKKLVYYCDMDGVLADFFKMPNALGRFNVEMDFFKMLAPITENVNAIKTLIANGETVKILSASPNEKADHAKRVWLARHIPEVKENNIIIVRLGESKIARVPKNERKRAVLFDDYGKNLREWVANGGKCGIKILGDNPRKENRPYHQITNINEWVKL
jgi:5'(3')-deoxyribonucleotidase